MSYSTGADDGAGRTAVPPATTSCAVPNTPDVISSIMSMIGPFDHYARGSPASDDSSGSTCSLVSPLRMQSICPSQLIKEELKLAIRSKQKNAAAIKATGTRGTHLTGGGGAGPGVSMNVAATASDGSAASSPGGGQAKRRRIDEESHDDDDDDDGEVSSHGEGLTAEDEERRRRRRERNKIAATKCRLKKREKTSNLMQESNVLETKNYDLKSQIQELETQRNELMKMLKAHPCTRRHPHQQEQHHRHEQQHHHQQQQHHHQHQQHQQQHHLREQYAVEAYTTNGGVPYGQQHHHVAAVAAEPPILKDTMFNVGGGVGYGTAPVNQPTAAYHRPAVTTTATAVSAVHYPVISGMDVVGIGGDVGGVGYSSCVDDLYGYSKDLIAAGGGAAGPPDLSHQYYDQGIC